MTAGDDPETTGDFADGLAALVRLAVENGVQVEGGWEVDDPGAGGKWSVEITRVEREE